MMVAQTVDPAMAALLLAQTPLAPRGDRPLNKLAGLFDRIGGPVVRAPIACIAAGVVAAIACFALWRSLEHNMVPSFKETDLVVEWQGPPGTSLQAMTRSTEGLIRDLRQIPGV